MNDISGVPLRPSRRVLYWLGGTGIVIALAVVVLGALPVGLMRALVERRVADAVDAPVTIGGLTRDPWFSFTPTVSVNTVRIAQPAWVGSGDFVRIDRASVRVPVFAALFGRFKPDRISIDGIRVALVRDASGRSNWSPKNKGKTSGSRPSLANLAISNARFILRDAKRDLTLAGSIMLDDNGLAITGEGTFRSTPARLTARGGRVTNIDPAAPYPIRVALTAPALTLTGTGSTTHGLDLSSFNGRIHATAPTLKNLDYIIEAGLFGSAPIAFDGDIRHDGRDWFIDRIGGSIGRSTFTGKTTVRKHDDRTAIDATIRAARFDFDDLSDAQGRAEAMALKSRVGPRVIPATRINLSKIGKTDGTIRFAADRLLFKTDSVFKSLAGTLTLDHRLLTVSNLRATLSSGTMTGSVRVDHRSGAPKLAVDLRFAGATLDAIIGKPDAVSGPVRAHVRLSGSGDTIREALAHANGSAAMVSDGGRIKATIAAVLGQDLGATIGQQFKDSEAQVPLVCLVADFRARGGVLTPSPLAIDTGNSVGRGSGRIVLGDEAIALTLTGSAKNPTGLRIVDPIRIGGTLSAPALSVAGLNTSGPKPKTGDLLRVVTRSLGAALGIGKDRAAPPPPRTSLNCPALVAAALH